MNELQKNSKNNLVDTLECLASTTEQTSYKNSVPFVHIPYELICQWDSHFIKDQQWFRNIWTSQEWKALSSFNETFNRICQEIPNQGFQDIPDVHANPLWIEMIAAANVAIQIMMKGDE